MSIYQFVDEDLLKEWTIADRSALIELLTKFEHLNKASRVEDIKAFLMVLLTNRSIKTQNLALRCLLNLKNPVYNKYQDNLKNLLDDTLFRDEIIKFLQNDDENTIDDKDLDTLMPVILRILYGRAQTKGTGNKQSIKTAAIKLLPNFQEKYIIDFLHLSFHKIHYNEFFESGELDTNISFRLLKNITGFFNMNLDVVNLLRRKHNEALAVLIKPLLYSLSASEYVISHPSEFNENDENYDKVARNNRQSGFKLLYMVTDYLGKSFDWKPYGDIIYKNLVEPKMEHFADENLQGPSSLTKLMTSLWSDEHLHFFLYYNDYQPVNVLLSILSNKNAKDTILISILNFVLSLLENSNDSEEFVNVMAIIISSCLDSLVLLLENSVNVEVNSKAVQILLTFVEREFITENGSRKILVASLTTALDKPSSQMSIKVKADCF
ncbi:unnamed protein product [Ambrosiozyma monospora]|uniref:Unnamed protein product n=1 Tax=Ambrosiozyma monospora TaxID=43982 RepID=A0ACB5T9N1_AMBMO|nr:unnamed protein product [Ambrosiozyma monospora]